MTDALAASRGARGPKTPGGPVGAIISWVVVLGCVLIIAAGQAAGPREEEGAEPDAPAALEHQTPAGGMLEAISKAVVGAPEADRDEAASMLPMLATRDVDLVRLVPVTGFVEGIAAAQKELDDLEAEIGAEGALAEDIATLRTLYHEGEYAVGEVASARMAERHDWFWKLARASVRPEGDPLRQEVVETGRRTFVIIAAWELGLLGVMVISFGLFVTGIVLLATGKIRRRYIPPAPGGSAYMETFTLFLALLLPISLAAAFAAGVLGPFGGLLRWALLGALAWPLVRGATWGNIRAAVGWYPGPSLRGIAKEMGMGAVGYLACLPLVGIGVAMTLGLMALMTAFREEAGEGPAPLPAHPLGDMLAEAGPLEIVLLFALATLWAPIVEETFFRGALYHHLRGRLHWTLAGLVNGAIFAAIHPQGVLAIPALMTIGFVLSLLREWRGSLIPSMTAHALSNGVITLLLVVMMS